MQNREEWKLRLTGLKVFGQGREVSTRHHTAFSLTNVDNSLTVAIFLFPLRDIARVKIYITI